MRRFDFAWLPQSVMLHHRRLPFFDVSTKRYWQPSCDAHALTRPSEALVASSIADCATSQRGSAQVGFPRPAQTGGAGREPAVPERLGVRVLHGCEVTVVGETVRGVPVEEGEHGLPERPGEGQLVTRRLGISLGTGQQLPRLRGRQTAGARRPVDEVGVGGEVVQRDLEDAPVHRVRDVEAQRTTDELGKSLHRHHLRFLHTLF